MRFHVLSIGEKVAKQCNQCNYSFSEVSNLRMKNTFDVYQYICGTGLFSPVFLHHAVLSVPINCLPEMVEVHLLSGHLFDSVFSNVSSNSMPVRMQSHIGCICLTFLHCASLNVSSNCLPEKRHSRTDYICLAFLNCVFSNVFSNCLPEKRQSHIGCIFLLFSTVHF